MRRSAFALGWGKGAIHPNTSNFRRVARLDCVARARKLCEFGLLKERPKWLEWAERVPPMENHSLSLQVRTIRNPYPQMIAFLLKKYPDLRFQDCYVDGNDWSTGNDTFRDDHPVMQFVARQLDFMNQGLSKKEAFAKAEDLFRDRREYLEREQKVMMAIALDSGLAPMFATGRAYLEAEKAKAETAHLQSIQRQLRQLRKHTKDPDPAKRGSIGALRHEEKGNTSGMDRQRRDLIGDVSDLLPTSADELGLVAPSATSSPATAAMEAADPEETPLDRTDDDVFNELIAREKLDASPESSPTRQTTFTAAQPVKEVRPVPQAEMAPEKPEESVQIISRRSASERRTYNREDVSSLIGVRGGVLSEDKQDDDFDDATNRARSKRREKGTVVLDDFEDDGDDTRGGGGRRR